MTYFHYGYGDDLKQEIDRLREALREYRRLYATSAIDAETLAAYMDNEAEKLLAERPKPRISSPKAGR